MNAYTREMIEREADLLQSRREQTSLEPEAPAHPAVRPEVVPGEIAPERSQPSPRRTAVNALWQVLQTPVPDLLSGAASRKLYA
jgi:hypothetical protein